ncbi:MAG: RDD family protein [Opitutaceae bacterium]
MNKSTHLILRKLLLVLTLLAIPPLFAQDEPAVKDPAPVTSEEIAPEAEAAPDIETVSPVDKAANLVSDPIPEMWDEKAEEANSDEAGIDESTSGAPSPPAPPSTEEIRRTAINEVVKIFDDAVVQANEVASDFVVVIGDGRVDGMVKGDAVVVLGNATVNGQVQGDLVNVMGTAVLGPQAVVNGEVVVIGGKLIKADGAAIKGATTQVSFLPSFRDGQFEWLSIWIHKGLLMGRPLPHDQGWAWITAGILLLIALVIALVFRRAIDATVAVLEHRPAAALLTGLLVCILSGPLFFLLLVSVIGIPIIPFLIIGVKIAAVFGIIALYRHAGQQFGLRSMPALALVVGGIVFTLLYAVPVVGLLTLLVASILGTGATCLAMVQGLRRESTGTSPGSAPMSPISPIAKAVATPTTAALTSTGEATTGPGTETFAPETDTPLPLAAEITEDPLMAVRVGFWPRFGATALDFILIAGLTALTDLDWMLGYLWLGYHLVFWAWRQTTIGGIVMNLKVVRLDGQKLSFGVVAVRSLASIFSGLVVGLGFFWASWDEERQSWHDKIAGTTIVRVPKGTSLL